MNFLERIDKQFKDDKKYTKQEILVALKELRILHKEGFSILHSGTPPTTHFPGWRKA